MSRETYIRLSAARHSGNTARIAEAEALADRDNAAYEAERTAPPTPAEALAALREAEAEYSALPDGEASTIKDYRLRRFAPMVWMSEAQQKAIDKVSRCYLAYIDALHRFGEYPKPALRVIPRDNYTCCDYTDERERRADEMDEKQQRLDYRPPWRGL